MCSVGEAPGTSLGTPASPNEPFVVVLEKGFLKNEISPSGMDFEICNFVDLFMPKHTHYTLTKIQKVKKHNRTPLNHRFWTKYHSLFFRLKFFPRFLQWKKSSSPVVLLHQNPVTYLCLVCAYFSPDSNEVTFFTGESNIMNKGLIEQQFEFNVLMLDLFLTNTQFFTSQYINWWAGSITGLLRILVMFLSAVWTLILTAPIHCRGSIGEQV